jgi:spermidine synthase
MISPFLIRLETDRTGLAEARTGKQSGFFMSLSTAGSIAGTLLASYLFIPLWGVRTTVAVASFAFLLVPVALLLSERKGRWELPAVAVLLVLAATSLVVAVRAKPNAEVLYDTESFYGNIRVVSETDEAGRVRLAYRPSRVYTHSVLYPDEPLRELVGSLYLLPALIEPPGNILVLGSAAGGVLRQAEELFPQAAVVGVDLDPSVHAAAVQAFGVDPEKASLVASDARAYLATHEQQFDFIIVDLFAGEFVPSHCITETFFALVKSRLRPGGALFVNTNMNDVPFEFASDAAEPFRAFRHLASTLEAAGFPSLFENLHFHALYAFPREVSFAHFHGQMRDLRQRAGLPAPARAAAGLALRTTVPAASYRARYRPFSDEWAPEMLIELKSNKEALFEYFAELPRQQRAGVVRDDHPVAQYSISKLLEQGASDGDFWSLSEPDALIRELNQVERPLGAGDAELAARYLRFGMSEESRVRAETPWARVTELYARLSTQAYGNDYEGLLSTLAQLDGELGDSAPP